MGLWIRREKEGPVVCKNKILSQNLGKWGQDNSKFFFHARDVVRQEYKLL